MTLATPIFADLLSSSGSIVTPPSFPLTSLPDGDPRYSSILSDEPVASLEKVLFWAILVSWHWRVVRIAKRFMSEGTERS